MNPDTLFSGVRMLGAGVDVLGDLLVRDGADRGFRARRSAGPTARS